MSFTEFYPAIEPYEHQLLDVGDGHQLYVEQCGNPQGIPMLFIHGGPGAGCSKNDRRFFNPAIFRVVLFDQRGCGRSLPHGELDNNTTSDLVADIEKIRCHLGIEQWHVFGGSWGSTLSLVYAQQHPQQVLSLTLRGIFLAREQDTNWTFAGGGASRIFADSWQRFLTDAGITEREFSIENCYCILTGDDKQQAMKMARAWSIWEISSCTLLPDEAFLSQCDDDKSCWTLARHEAYYMVNQCFLSDNQILTNCDKIAEIPTTIVHGRYDIVCPFDNAWLLHQALPNSKLVISHSGGHASAEPETRHHLIAACDDIAAGQF
ncbi:prolyl aminopeptidase [Neptunicella marina]|uniref:Proline iminopeptidase n=1 Tax=Neptunicella marina TaxID=2125989 RepID=A0A8J6IQH8_9ALTE|nr:prolyl aminopeptidase [Neptunicella marina]MBC3765091.1 prolyl aminopeptidase [Neptunicella marina]